MTSGHELADELVALTVARLEGLHERHLPGWRVPAVFGGHRVNPDVSADLVYTLGHLDAAGVGAVAGTPVDDAVRTVLGRLDGAGTHTFFSYRVAETLSRRGQFAGNPLLDGLTPEQRDEVARACDSTDWLPLLDSGLPRNYAAVIARCEAGRAALGLPADPAVLDGLVDRTRSLLTANPNGYLDDSEDGAGGRYDIYTADLYLFCEPLAGRLGDAWTTGARHAVELVERVVARNGAAVVWGRSTGALSLCLTVELAAFAAAHGVGTDIDRWLGLASRAAHELASWFDEDSGLIRAHQHRATYAYRGPFRRLQMTLDCLGKLAWAAQSLRARDPDPGTPGREPDLFPTRDELIVFDSARHAAVWTYRSAHAAFVLPLVGASRSDYQPSPHTPGLFEQPVDSHLGTWTPVAFVGEDAYVGAGLPMAVEHRDGELVATYDGLVESARIGAGQGRRLACDRTVRHRVDGRSLHVEEHLRFIDRVPDAIAVTVPEADGRPLVVELTCTTPHAANVVDTAGIREWRSFWGELPRLHEFDVEPLPELTWRMVVTPVWRIATDMADHTYGNSLYGAMGARAVARHFSRVHLGRERGDRQLRRTDLFHLHWPEWMFGEDLAAAEEFCAVLDRHDVRLVWTQHNLLPHLDGDEATFRRLYELMARRADGIIHHTASNRERSEARWPFRTDATHAVVTHGHWGDALTDVAAVDRREAERELGLPPLSRGGLRIGVVGAPRRAKRTAALMEAFTRTARDDLQLLVLSLDEGDSVPDDDRIVAVTYTFVDRATYNRRLATIDVLALPFEPDGHSLTTGLVADAIGLGRPALVSSWRFLQEALGDAGIPMGDSVDDMAAAIDGLTPAAVASAAEAAGARQAETSWSVAAEATLGLYEAVGTAKL